MRWNANRRSGRPTDPSAYWRRRFFILGGGLAVLAVLAWQFTGKGPSAKHIGGRRLVHGFALQAGRRRSRRRRTAARRPRPRSPPQPRFRRPPLRRLPQARSSPAPSRVRRPAPPPGPPDRAARRATSCSPWSRARPATGRRRSLSSTCTRCRPRQQGVPAAVRRRIRARGRHLSSVGWCGIPRRARPAAAKPGPVPARRPATADGLVEAGRPRARPAALDHFPLRATGTFDAVAQTVSQSSHVTTCPRWTFDHAPANPAAPPASLHARPPPRRPPMPDDPPEEAASEPDGTMARRRPIRSRPPRPGAARPPHVPHLVSQAHLADRDHALRDGRVRHRTRQRDSDRQVHRRLGQPDPANRRRVHVLLAYLDVGAALQHREHHAHPGGVEVGGDTA